MLGFLIVLAAESQWVLLIPTYLSSHHSEMDARWDAMIAVSLRARSGSTAAKYCSESG